MGLPKTVWLTALSCGGWACHGRDHIDAWLQFASLCRQNGNFSLAEKILIDRLALQVRITTITTTLHPPPPRPTSLLIVLRSRYP